MRKLPSDFRRLTRSQHDALEKLDNEHRLLGSHAASAAAVIGWDTAVSGPLITLDRFGDDGPFVAVSPRGKVIPRDKASVLL